MSDDQPSNPAEMYEEYFVPGIHARWTPVFLDYAGPEPGDRVLDVACGTGVVTREVAPIVGSEGSVVGLDISPDMLTVARRLPHPVGAAVEWRESTAASLPDGPFDLIVCQQGLQFFPDRPAAVAEMRRVLAPGGRACVSVWQGLDRHPLYRAMCVAEADHLGVPVEEVAVPFTLKLDELRGLFREAGFHGIEIVPQSREVRFPSPDRFIALTLLAAASIIPESEMDADARAAMVRAVSAEIDEIVRAYVEGDEVAFPMHAHVAVAHA